MIIESLTPLHSTAPLHVIPSLTGDLRLTPFYDFDEGVAKVKGYVDELNKGKTLLIVVFIILMILILTL